MGSKVIQGELWGQQPEHWAQIQEETGMSGYEYVLKFLSLKPGEKVLDGGCGSGLFSSMAMKTGSAVTGIDASEKLIFEAKKRTESVDFLTGEMEELPFEENNFDVVCGFNSFQYAADVENALQEARRVLKEKGRLIVMIWGNKEDCEAATYLKAVGSLLPSPPPGAPGPFALSENSLLENILGDIGFTLLDHSDITSVWDYPNVEIALKGLLSAGPVARAVRHSGFEKVHKIVSDAVVPYVQDNGHVVYKNKFRIVIAEK